MTNNLQLELSQLFITVDICETLLIGIIMKVIFRIVFENIYLMLEYAMLVSTSHQPVFEGVFCNGNNISEYWIGYVRTFGFILIA